MMTTVPFFWVCVYVCGCVCISVSVCMLQYSHSSGIPSHDQTMDADDNEVTLTFESAKIRMSRSIYEDTMGPQYYELWQEILFPENETHPHVQLVFSEDDTELTGSMCVYITHPNVTDSIENDTTSTINFHCARGHSQPCLNNGTCDNKDCRRPGGICNCNDTEGFEGVNCGIETANIDGPGCPLDCVHGTCVSDGVTGRCECQPGFAGDLCDKKAYYHECTPYGFNVCITPFSVETFWGDIYVTDQKYVPGCSLRKASGNHHDGYTVIDWCQGYVGTFSYNSDCGVLGPTIDDDMTKYELPLIVQYAEVRTCTDEKVTLICQYNRHALQLYKSVSIDTGGHQHVQTETVHFSPVVMTMTGADGTHLHPPLKVGFKVKLCIYISAVTGFHGVIINNIVVNNTRDGVDYREISLYDEGCVSDSLRSVVDVIPHWSTSSDKSRICFQFKIFFFDHDADLTSLTLGLVSNVSIFSDAANAIMPTCESRRKRQAVTEERETVIGTTISISIPETVTVVPVAKDDTSRPWLTPTVYAVGFVVAIVAVVLMACIVTKCRRRQRKDVP